MPNTKGVLNGYRVLDFGRYIAGPFCGALLSDFGAEVIRVERVKGSEDRLNVTSLRIFYALSFCFKTDLGSCNHRDHFGLRFTIRGSTRPGRSGSCSLAMRRSNIS